jgi:hypothetical protein
LERVVFKCTLIVFSYYKDRIMKQLITLILFLSIFQSILAQEWQPFQVENTYNYQNLDVIGTLPFVFVNTICTVQYSYVPNYPNLNVGLYPIVDLQIWIDSTTMNNLDSIYYFNKRIIACDTCSEPAIVVNQSLEYGLFNDYYIKNNQGQYIFFYKGDSLIVDPFMSLNDSILSDYTSGLSAKVEIDSSLGLAFTNGVIQDSVKLIYYYDINNVLVYEILISKNYGIQKFKDIAFNANETNLIGIEERAVGLLQLNWKRTFDFNVGDVLCYLDVNRHNLNYRHNTSKVEFLNRQDIGNDTVIYSVIINRRWEMGGFPFGMGTTIDTVNLILTKDRIITETYYPELYNNSFRDISRLELRDNELSLDYYQYYQGLFSSGKGLSSKNFLLDADGRQYKYFSYGYGLENSFSATWRINAPNFDIDTTSNIYYYDYYYDRENLKEIYGAGIGLVYRYEYQFEGFSCHSLIGYVKGIDTVGTILSDQLFLGEQRLSTVNTKSLNMEVYPNPVDKYLNIKLDGLTETRQVQFVLSDLYGKIIQTFSEQAQESYELEVGDLNVGIYLLQLKNDEGILLGFKKIVVN